MCDRLRVCVRVCMHLPPFSRAGREYLNNSPINISGRFIGFEAYLPFVGKH